MELTSYSRSVRNIYRSYTSSGPNYYTYNSDRTGSTDSPMGYHTSLSQASWYRFGGEAGTRMATTPPPYKSCGTTSPGWLATALPVCPRFSRQRA